MAALNLAAYVVDSEESSRHDVDMYITPANAYLGEFLEYRDPLYHLLSSEIYHVLSLDNRCSRDIYLS
jgi:hypothetical protein